MAENSQLPITYDEVAAAAQALFDANEKVTIIAIREKLKRGSFTTVKKFLDRWQQSQGAGPIQTSAVPQQLESLWQEARRAAEGNLAEERDALGALAAELEARFDQMEAAVADAENGRKAAEARLADKDSELARLGAVADDLRAQRDRTEALLAQTLDAATRERGSWIERMGHLEKGLAELGQPIDGLATAVSGIEMSIREQGAIVVTEIAEFQTGETQGRLIHHQQLRDDLVRQTEPLARVVDALAEIDRRLYNRDRAESRKHHRRHRVVASGTFSRKR